ncbi:SPOR domain-containing protein [Brevundimonas sp.]|jgi:hypothetical protein|uniref:SPOR domain-containing protein n=1 Tax=Brevundimonas sp. TaxID=1871086 RepID=UPI001837CB1E|nr:SPOR domain-containing protein [Brevundimonas sp.]MBA4807471.1 SPOR domain-containing protein [Brevundimonas sp.]
MTPAEATRPVLIVLALTLAGCGAIEGDRHRFQTMADHVAAIDIPMNPQADRPGDPQPRRTAEAQGLRPLKFSPVKVAVMSPHEMWDAREGLIGAAKADEDGTSGLRDAVVRMAEPAVAPLLPGPAPKVVETVAAAAEQPRLRPAVIRSGGEGRMIQLGAYSSEAGARAAWNRLKAGDALSSLSPVFETIHVDGRMLTRLKVGPIPAEAASALCAAAQVADPWCRRAG